MSACGTTLTGTENANLTKPIDQMHAGVRQTFPLFGHIDRWRRVFRARYLDQRINGPEGRRAQPALSLPENRRQARRRTAARLSSVFATLTGEAWRPSERS